MAFTVGVVLSIEDALGGAGQARDSIVVESSVLTSDRESDLAKPHVTAGEVQPELFPSLEPKPPGQLREDKPGQVNLSE